MKCKRILSLALTGALLCSLLLFPSASAAQISAFSDISDPAVAQAAEMLRLLNIVSGTGTGNFEPNRTLSRAEFCKMSVEVMGNGDAVASMMNRTVFKDVPATHWARGYINVATQVSTSGGGKDSPSVTQPGIIRGDAYGFFNPDRPITFAEAVTILVRILKYTDADVGLIWPDGYLATAKSIGLTDGIVLAPSAPITRGQSALLFNHLLNTKMKGDEKEFLTTLGMKTVDEALILAVDAEAPDGSANAVKLADGKIYKTNRYPFAPSFVGSMGKLVLDKDDRVLDIQKSTRGSQKTVNLIPGEYQNLKTGDGALIPVKPDTVVWQDGKKTTYGDVWQKLRAGTQAVLQYTNAGELDYVFLHSAVTKNATAMVAKNKPGGNPFGALADGQTGYAIYKNGVPATDKDIRQYDAATFDKGANVLYVSDLRLTGVYENAFPNPQTAARVTLMGQEFPVLDSAVADLSSFKIGEIVTLLLTYDGQVAGAVSPDVAKSTTVGVASLDAEGNATVTPLMDLRDGKGSALTLSGATSYKGNSAEQMQGQLVVVSSSQKGRLNLSKLSSSGSTAALNVAQRRLGSVSLAENVRLYERVNTSVPVEIRLKDITRNSVPSANILYVHNDYAGKADIIVFEDVTGDQYTYGLLSYTSAVNIPGEGGGLGSYTNATVAVKNAGAGAGPFVCGADFKNGAYGGIAASLSTLDGQKKLAGSAELSAIKGVSSHACDTDKQLVTTPSAIYPIADNVQCYNKTTKTWFAFGKNAAAGSAMAALDMACAFSDTLTIYVDKAPEDGGKVRIVVVE